MESGSVLTGDKWLSPRCGGGGGFFLFSGDIAPGLGFGAVGGGAVLKDGWCCCAVGTGGLGGLGEGLCLRSGGSTAGMAATGWGADGEGGGLLSTTC